MWTVNEPGRGGGIRGRVRPVDQGQRLMLSSWMGARNLQGAPTWAENEDIDRAESLREVLKFGEHVIEARLRRSRGAGQGPLSSKPEVVLCDIGLPA